VREEIEHIREGKHGARSWPEWHEDKAYLGVILRTISVWRGVNLMTGFGKKGGRTFTSKLPTWPPRPNDYGPVEWPIQQSY
jgi:hypothetical protein